MNMIASSTAPRRCRGGQDPRRRSPVHTRLRGISVTRRRNGLSALSGVERICGMPAGAIELTCPNLRRLLYRKPPAAFGFAPQRFGKLLIALRYVMRGMGLHAPKPSLNGLTAAWRDLFDALPSLRDAAPGYRQIALGAFIGFSSDAGIEPTDVSAEVLEIVRNVLTNHTLVSRPATFVRRTVSNWNWARSHVSAWESLPELRRPSLHEHYTSPLESWPPSLQEDGQRYLDGLAGKNQDEIYHDNVRARTGRRRRRAASPRTVQTRIYSSGRQSPPWFFRACRPRSCVRCGISSCRSSALRLSAGSTSNAAVTGPTARWPASSMLSARLPVIIAACHRRTWTSSPAGPARRGRTGLPA